VALGGEVLATGGLAKEAGEGRARIEAAFRSGKAAELFGRMVAALGGPADFVERPAKHLRPATVVHDVTAAGEGTVSEIDTRAIGIAVVELGGGRMRASDTIDHAVGFTALAGLGAKIGKGVPLGRLHARDAATADRAAASLRAAYRLGQSAPVSHTVYERIGA